MCLNSKEGFAGILGLLISTAIILIMAVMLLGGGGDPESDSANLSGDESTHPKDQDETAIKKPIKNSGIIQVHNATKLRLKLIQVQKSIQGFEALEGRKPSSLDELKAPDYQVPALPAGLKYVYDPLQGTVAIKKGEKLIVK